MSGYRGSCLCGEIAFAVEGEIEDVSHCHCGMCRKAHGAAFATFANVPADRHRFIRGTPKVYRSSATVERHFCGSCGSPMLWRDPVHYAGEASFPLGALDTPFVPKRERHIFVASKAPWHEIRDDWPKQDEA